MILVDATSLQSVVSSSGTLYTLVLYELLLLLLLPLRPIDGCIASQAIAMQAERGKNAQH